MSMHEVWLQTTPGYLTSMSEGQPSIFVGQPSKVKFGAKRSRDHGGYRGQSDPLHRLDFRSSLHTVNGVTKCRSVDNSFSSNTVWVLKYACLNKIESFFQTW